MTTNREQWFPGLSSEMNRAVEMVINYGELIKYKGGFWHKENADLKPLRNGGDIVGYYPEGYVGTHTITSLINRGILVVTRRESWCSGELPSGVKLVESNSKL